MKGTKQIAQRLVNTEKIFIDTIQEKVDCTEKEALKVLKIYKKEKIVKFDAVGGRPIFKHGVFLENDVIKNAINA